MSEQRPGAGSNILRLTGPLVISFWLRAAFQWIDSFFAAELDGAQGWGDVSRAAITLTVPFEFMIIACWVGTSNGLTARLAAAMGAREGDRVEQLKRVTKRLTVVLSALFLLISAAVFFGAEHYVKGEIEARQFKIYAAVLLSGSAVTSFWSILPDSIVKAHHDTKSTMWAGVLSGTTNAVLNTVFMYVFHWGIFGIAFSTVLGRIAGLAFALHRAAVHERRRVAGGKYVEPGTYARPIAAILAIAFPASLTFLLMSFESLAVNEILRRGIDATPRLAAWGLFDQTVRFMAMPLIACGVAMLPLAARCYGNGDLSGIRNEVRTALGAAAIYSLVIVLPFAWFLGPPLTRFLTNGELAQEWTKLGMRYVPLAVVAMGPIFILRSTFEGMQMPRPGLVVSLIRTVLLVVPLTWIGVQVAPQVGLLAIEGAYLGFIIGVGISSGLMGWLLRTELDRRRGSVGTVP